LREARRPVEATIDSGGGLGKTVSDHLEGADDRAGWVSVMTRADLVDELARAASLTKQDSEAVVDTVFASITDALARGDKVEIRGFGSFKIRQRRSRIGRNPKTGASVSVPGKKVPFFKVGKGLRELVNT
jgi:integration host factor subunit beta